MAVVAGESRRRRRRTRRLLLRAEEGVGGEGVCGANGGDGGVALGVEG